MSAASVQAALLQIYLDPTVRAEVEGGRTATLRDVSMSPAERSELIAFARTEHAALEYFSGMLRVKREAAIRRLTPLCAMVLGAERWSEAWNAYRAGTVSESFTNAVDEAYAFVQSLAPLVAETPEFDRARDLFTFERLKLEVSRRAGRGDDDDLMVRDAVPASYPRLRTGWCLYAFAHDVRALAEAFGREAPPSDAELGDGVTILFCRSWHDDTAITLEVDRTLAVALSFASGSTSIEAMLRRSPLLARYGPEPLVRALSKLAGRGAVRFAPQPRDGGART